VCVVRVTCVLLKYPPYYRAYLFSPGYKCMLTEFRVLSSKLLLKNKTPRCFGHGLSILNSGTSPLRDIVITNVVWCIVYKREVGRRVAYCPIIGQYFCTRVGNAGGRGNERMVDSCTTASK